MPEILRRADLYKTGKKRNELCLAFLDERDLQRSLRIFVDCLEPLHHEYCHHLECHKGGSLAMLKWHAKRATGHVALQTICATLNLASSPDMVRRLGFSAPGPVAQRDDRELALADQLFRFTVELAGNRAWSQKVYETTMPWMACGVFAKTLQTETPVCAS